MALLCHIDLGVKMLDILKDLHYEDLRNELHPSYFFESDEYKMFIIRLPKIVDGKLTAYNTGFTIDQNNIYIYDKASDSLKFFSDNSLDMYNYIDKLVDNSILILENYIEQFLVLEESLYSKNLSSNFMDYWFELKKDLLRIERIYLRALTMLKMFIKSNEIDETFPKYKFLDIEEHLDRNQRDTSLILSKLDTIYNYYVTIKNDKLNNSVYILTLVSVIFLPLNLVVGFFGINTTDLFFTNTPEGSMSVIYLLLFLFIFMIILIPISLKIYKKIFGRFLNR